jgi:hypothetical protein
MSRKMKWERVRRPGKKYLARTITAAKDAYAQWLLDLPLRCPECGCDVRLKAKDIAHCLCCPRAFSFCPQCPPETQ